MKGTLTIRELRNHYVTSICVPFIQKPVHCFAVQSNDWFHRNEALAVRQLRRQCISHPDENLPVALQCKPMTDSYMNGALVIISIPRKEVSMFLPLLKKNSQL